MLGKSMKTYEILLTHLHDFRSLLDMEQLGTRLRELDFQGLWSREYAISLGNSLFGGYKKSTKDSSERKRKAESQEAKKSKDRADEQVSAQSNELTLWNTRSRTTTTASQWTRSRVIIDRRKQKLLVLRRFDKIGSRWRGFHFEGNSESLIFTQE